MVLKGVPSGTEDCDGKLGHEWQKVSTWIREVEYLSSIAASQLHAAYAVFTHGQINKWTYLSRTIPDIEKFLKPLEDTIRQQFLPALTGQNAFKDLERDLNGSTSAPWWIQYYQPVQKCIHHLRSVMKDL